MNKTAFTALLFTFLLVCAANVLGALEPNVQAAASVYPIQLQPGSDGYIQLTLTNLGTAAANRVKISKVSTDAPIVSEGWVTELGSINAGSSIVTVLKFSVLNNALPGLYSITFSIDYCQDSICKTIYPSAILNVQTPAALEVSAVRPSTLKLGEKTNITFVLSNKGVALNNVIFTWSAANNVLLPIGSANRIVIGSISANSVHEVKAEVAVSPTAVPGVYPINIYLQYADRTGVNQTISTVAGIQISGETDFDVSAQDYSQGSVTLAITNIGSSTAYSTIVRIPEQRGFKAVGSSSSVVGNLNAGDYTMTNFQVVPLVPNATERLLVEISYTDLLGVRRSVQKEVMLSAGNITIPRRSYPNARLTSSNSLVYIAIGVIGIVCLIAAIKLRKKIKKR